MLAMSSRRVSRARVTRRLHATRAAGRHVPSKEAMETGSVLVVDDDPKILELVRAYLRRAGYAGVTGGGGGGGRGQVGGRGAEPGGGGVMAAAPGRVVYAPAPPGGG